MTKPNCYHIDQFEELRPIFMQVIEYSQAMGLDMIQGDHEDAPGQLELNFTFDDALRTADRLTTYRQICAQVAREHGVLACFMSKPFMGVSASGCHHNVSLWTGGAQQVNTLHQDPVAGMDDTFSYWKGGENLFMPDTSIDTHKPGPVGLNCIGGVDGAPGRAHRARLVHRQLLPQALGHRLLGAGLRRLGLPEPHLRPARLGTGAASSTARWIRW